MTALTLYPLVSQATSTLATASSMTTTSGASAEANVGTSIDALTGYGEYWPLGRGVSSTWAQGGSLGSASDHGWLWDVATLEGQTIAAGTWTFFVTMNADVAPVGDMYFTTYKRSSGGIYTTIGTLSLTAQTINGFNNNTFTLTGSLIAMAFLTGDKLYGDFQENITTNAGSFNGAEVYIKCNNTANIGDSAVSLVTPGYSASPPPPPVSNAPPLPFNPATLPTTIAASRIIRGSDL